jgi:DNA-binding SARP family transcriptional activator/class 3 adenylate cyclase
VAPGIRPAEGVASGLACGFVQVGLLGPLLVVRDNGVEIAVAAPKERAVLELLALRAGTTVRAWELIDALWGDEPPRSATKTLQTYVSSLRRLLSAGAIETAGGGYRLVVPADAVDVLRFEDLVRRGGRALEQGNATSAMEALTAGLRLWRGEPVVELTDQPTGLAEATRLGELRRGCEEQLAEARLLLGEHHSLVADLEAAVAAEPLRERRWAQLMLALYRTGRQAEALRAFQRLRAQLADELGIEPSAEVRALEEAILLQKPELDGPKVPAPAGPPSTQDRPGPAGVPMANESSVRHTVSLTGGLLTFVFTDIEGSTHLWEQHPAHMAAVVDRHDHLVGDAITGEGGQVFKTVGDAVHAVFASPLAALRAALDVQAVISANDWGDVGGLAVRIGVYTGEAQWVESEWRGRPLNRCARLRDAASGGHILVSRATIELVGDDLANDTVVSDLGPQQLRGVPRTEQVYEVQARGTPTEAHKAPATIDSRPEEPASVPAPSAQASRRSLIGRHLELERVTRHLPPDTAVRLPSPLTLSSRATLVGRRREREILGRTWKAAVAGRRGAVFVSGEPGIGKTRLLADLAETAARDGGIVLYGCCDEDLKLAYLPFEEALRHAEWTTAGDATEIGGPLARWSRQDDVPSEMEDGYLRVASDVEAWFLVDALERHLISLSCSRPVLLILDDLQWATSPTVSVTQRLVRSSDPASLMIAALYRDSDLAEDHPMHALLASVKPEHHAARIVLSGLDADSVESIVARLIPELSDDPELIGRAIQQETAGNPLFVEELLTHLRESGEPHERLRAGELSLEPPQSVSDVIERRVRTLPPNGQRALTVASVAGLEFDVAVVGTVMGDFDEALDGFDQALGAKLVEETRDAAGIFRFTHAVIRRTLYNRLSSARCAQLHGEVALAIEAQPYTGSSRVGSLADHFAKATTNLALSKGPRYCSLAAEWSLRRLAPQDARSFAQRGLDLLARVDSPDLPVRADLLLWLARASYLLGDVAGSREYAERAAADARAVRSPQRMLAAASARSWHGSAGVSDPLVEDLCHSVLELADEGAIALRARALAILAFYRATSVGLALEADPFAAEAVDLARRSTDRELLWESLYARARTSWASDQILDRLAVADEMVLLSAQQPALEMTVQSRLVRAVVRLERGDRAGFDEDLTAVEAFAADRPTYWLPAATANMWRAMVALAEDRLDDAETHSKALYRMLPPSDINLRISQAAQLFAIRRQQGRLAELMASAESTMESFDLPALRTGLAWGLAETGNQNRAKQLVSSLLADGASDLRHDSTWTSELVGLAEAVILTDCTEHAVQVYDLLLPRSGQLLVFAPGILCAGAADRFLGSLSAMLGDRNDAESRFAHAMTLEQRMRMPGLVSQTEAARSRVLHAAQASESVADDGVAGTTETPGS